MKKYYYVYRVGHKGPTVKHHQLASAVREAERLAAQHPGAVQTIWIGEGIYTPNEY